MTGVFFLRSSSIERMSPVAFYGLVIAWTAGLMMVNTEWYYIPIFFVDPAVYLGWSLNPFIYRARFPSYPGGDLMPLILPNALAYYYLSPLNANLLIKFLSFSLCNVSIAFIVRKLFNLTTALFCLVSFSTYRYTLMAVGSDYTDGRVILYILLAASSGLGAAMYLSGSTRYSLIARAALFCISGFFAMMMVSTAILSLTLLPVIFGFSAVTATFHTWRKFIFTTMVQLFLMFLGFVVGAGLLSVLNLTVYGGTGFYAENTLNKLFYFLGVNRVFFDDWWIIGRWLMVAIGLVPLGVVFSISMIRRDRDYFLSTVKGKMLIILGLAGLTTVVGYIVLQFAFHQETLSNPTYFNFVVPLIFLFAAPVFYRLSKRLHPEPQLVLSVYAGFSLFLVGLFHRGIPSDFKLALVCIFLVILGLITFLYAKPHIKIAVFCIVLIALNFTSGVSQFRTQFSSEGRRANFLTVVRWVDLCNTLDRLRKAYVWYDLNETPGAAFIEMSSASHVWKSGGVLNEKFPKISDEEMRRITSNVSVEGQVKMFLFSQRDDAENVLVDRLHDGKLSAIRLEKKEFIWKDIPFAVYLFGVQKETTG